MFQKLIFAFKSGMKRSPNWVCLESKLHTNYETLGPTQKRIPLKALMREHKLNGSEAKIFLIDPWHKVWRSQYF